MLLDARSYAISSQLRFIFIAVAHLFYMQEGRHRKLQLWREELGEGNGWCSSAGAHGHSAGSRTQQLFLLRSGTNPPSVGFTVSST